jgi:hypothetical protein
MRHVPIRHVLGLRGLANAALVLAVVACNGKSDPAGDGGNDSTGSPTSLDGNANDANDNGDDVDDDGKATQGNDGATMADDGDSTATATGDESGTATGTGGMNDPTTPLDCGGKIYECGDEEDNDGDGFIDLVDPECTGPCDDDEATFQTGLPGDNVDCKQDCFFDGNSGQGDDGCLWHLTCDPLNPGANINCEYSGGNNCNNVNPNQDQGCIEFCTQFVPPGCDCFGCCEVMTNEGTVHIFLNSGPDCALDNLEACQPCTFNDSCGTPCVPEKCQVCFGETEPPEGCGMTSCPNDLPCNSNADCPTDFYCLLDCCYPPPPG